MTIMRISMLFLLAGGICVSTSCKKWIDIQPKTALMEDEQFATARGFEDALAGIYLKAASPSLYGGELTFKLPDILAQRYENKSAITMAYNSLASYNYTSNQATVATLSDIFAKMYNAIAQCNYLLSNLEKHPDVLTDTKFKLIKGEALAMRALLHFDLLRMYAPAYKNGANSQVLTIPYMDKYQIKPKEKLSMSAFLDRCEADFKLAESLLIVYPGIDHFSNKLSTDQTDIFLQFRQNRLNYWASKALLARLYLFKGDKPQAFKYAKEVIDGKKFGFINSVTIITDVESASSNLSFPDEHIFSVYNSQLKSTTEPLFKSANGLEADYDDLFSTKANLTILYETSSVGYGTDVRSPIASSNTWKEVTTSIVYSRKFLVGSNSSNRQGNLPVIKISEVYYIAAESAPTLAEAGTYLNTVRLARLIPSIGTPASELVLDAELLKEYRKEFYAEGQLWYYYKRKNTPTLTGGLGKLMGDAQYVFPIPNIELEFGL